MTKKVVCQTWDISCLSRKVGSVKVKFLKPERWRVKVFCTWWRYPQTCRRHWQYNFTAGRVILRAAERRQLFSPPLFHVIYHNIKASAPPPFPLALVTFAVQKWLARGTVRCSTQIYQLTYSCSARNGTLAICNTRSSMGSPRFQGNRKRNRQRL